MILLSSAYQQLLLKVIFVIFKIITLLSQCLQHVVLQKVFIF